MPNGLREKLKERLTSVFHDGDVEATIYPSYGFQQESNWIIPLRGWVHQNRRLPDRLIQELAQQFIHCNDADISNFSFRFDDFSDDSRSRQSVTIQFDSDGQQHTFPKSDLNGLIEMNVTLPVDTAKRLLAEQKSANGWLSFGVVSAGHRGNGRVHLIEPNGVSVVSDIDDTIKVTEVPGPKEVVLKNTFCHAFVPVNGMIQRYRDLKDAAFHYVSGGPWQLYEPLSRFVADAGFPAGTFHLNYFPKNFLSSDTRSLLIDSIAGSLGRTYDHKVEQITRLLQRFPGREFILIGDSGELDVEVYLRIRELFGAQVKEICIRDVVNDKEMNSFRLKEVETIIPAEKIVCATDEHYEKLAVVIQREHETEYIKNNKPPCGGG